MKSKEMEQFYPSFHFCEFTVKNVCDSTVKGGEIKILVDGCIHVHVFDKSLSMNHSPGQK